MQRWKCHKEVWAAKIVNCNPDKHTVEVAGPNRTVEIPLSETAYNRIAVMPDMYDGLIGGYLVQYEDNYFSWSSAKSFEAGYVRVTSDESDLGARRKMLENWFTYHAPDDDQKKQYMLIREAALAFAVVVLEQSPASADQSAAWRKIREAVMTANAAIACGGK